MAEVFGVTLQNCLCCGGYCRKKKMPLFGRKSLWKHNRQHCLKGAHSALALSLSDGYQQIFLAWSHQKASRLNGGQKVQRTKEGVAHKETAWSSESDRGRMKIIWKSGSEKKASLSRSGQRSKRATGRPTGAQGFDYSVLGTRVMWASTPHMDQHMDH